MTTTPPPAPPPGWYPDPSTGGERYWDGSAWATNAAPPEILPVPDVPDFDYRESPKEVLQRWGGFLGLVVLASLFFAAAGFLDMEILGLPALACIGGAVYWASRIRREPVDETPLSTTPRSDAARQRVFQEYLSRYVAASAGRVESATAYSAVVVHGEKVNHILHLLLSMATCGIWLPVWFFIAYPGGEEKTVIAVDQCGNITTD